MKTRILVLFFALQTLAVHAVDITGTWKSEFDSQIGHQKYTFTFKQDGAALTGKANSQVEDRQREAELKEGKVNGDTVSFVEMLSLPDNEIRIGYTGKVSADGNEIKFAREVGDLAKSEIVAKRDGPASPTPAAPATALRIRAGHTAPYTDSNGNVWLAGRGFEGGATVERDEPLAIAGTKDPTLFSSEHYSMDSFACKLPNGKYVAKLYFAETYEGVTGPGERIFSFNVQGREFKNFDVWVKAGGSHRAHVETVPVEVSNGEFRIVFTPQVENPQINAIEIIPQEGQVIPIPAAAVPAPTQTASTASATTPAATATTTALTGPTILQIERGQSNRQGQPDALWVDDRGN